MSSTKPNSVNDGQTSDVVPRPPVVWTVVLVAPGVLALLLLNGQHFTNALVFVGCVTASGLLWFSYRSACARQSVERGHLALLLHVVVIVAVAASLPARYQKQQTFNKAVDDAKIRSARQATEGSEDALPGRTGTGD